MITIDFLFFQILSEWSNCVLLFLHILFYFFLFLFLLKCLVKCRLLFTSKSWKKTLAHYCFFLFFELRKGIKLFYGCCDFFFIISMDCVWNENGVFFWGDIINFTGLDPISSNTWGSLSRSIYSMKLSIKVMNLAVIFYSSSNIGWSNGEMLEFFFVLSILLPTCWLFFYWRFLMVNATICHFYASVWIYPMG